ncbi:metalloendoproteinase 1-like [Vigna radiata var. radiata]|uniref:Metalloendoproteinase 1-like n=1 Tax=Vigna radiata var. radiata TaxID=3916 RepID=A0A1S3TE81_VIGRR|nr:metalloendoproteinase 1-like [Vigna radiata var. radiata]
MQTYHFAFIVLLFLLLHQSLSAIPYSSTAKVKKNKRGKTFENQWKREIWPPEPYAPQKKIKGLSLIKNYFVEFGYLQSFAPFSDFLDPRTISAIQTFQRRFNLQVTGNLNNQTLNQILLPRCGVPDKSFPRRFINNEALPSYKNRWFGKRNITYGFLPESEIPESMRKVFRDSFTRWASATGVLNLTETTYEKADIKVGFYSFTEGVPEQLYGISSVRLEEGSNVSIGEIRLDGSYYWAVPSENDSVSWEEGVLDLEGVAMHEIGHLLGLDHSFMKESVMYPYILPSQQQKIQLSNFDKNNILQQYNDAKSGYSGSWRVLVIILLSLGFGYMLLPA